jgi:ABC-type transport system involved in multi-copper enzyme maturation permease subunit
VGVLGSGASIFIIVAGWSFAALYVFLPLQIAPMVCLDEERGNLELMVVSGIGLGQYLTQKLASRLMATGALLLLALPLAGLAFTLGGVSIDHIIGSALCLVLALLQVGAVSLWIAVRMRSSERAVWQAYVQAVVHLGFAIPLFFLPLLIIGWIGLGLLGGERFAMAWSCQPFFLWMLVINNGCNWWHALLGGVPILVTAWMYYSRAMTDMASREREHRSETGLSPRHYHYRPPEATTPKHWWNRLTASRHEGDLPAENGLAWRELMRMPVLRLEHRILWLAIIVPMLPLILATVLKAETWQLRANRLGGWAMVPLIISGLVLLPVAAGVFSNERRRSTLEVLLVTPLSTRELIIGKLAGCRRLVLLAWLSAMALMTLGAFLGLLPSSHAEVDSNLIALAMFAVAAWLVQSCFMHLGLLCGMVLRHPVHAISTAVILGLGWCLLPGMLAKLTTSSFLVSELIRLANPVALINAIGYFQTGTSAHSTTLEALLGAIAFFACLRLALGGICLLAADRLLGRGVTRGRSLRGGH